MSLSQGHWAAGWWAQVFGSRPLPIPPTWLRCLSGPKGAKSLSCPDPGSTLPPAFCLPRFLVSCTPSWFWGPVVTLEDCLAAFFVADELKGDNMYSCERCKKLRNGVKYCKVLRLPEVSRAASHCLCLSLTGGGV